MGAIMSIDITVSWVQLWVLISRFHGCNYEYWCHGFMGAIMSIDITVSWVQLW